LGRLKRSQRSTDRTEMSPTTTLFRVGHQTGTVHGPVHHYADNFKSCLEGVNNQAEIFSTKTRNKLGKIGSTGVKTGLAGLVTNGF
jgi:hypothetical protein